MSAKCFEKIMAQSLIILNDLKKLSVDNATCSDPSNCSNSSENFKFDSSYESNSSVILETPIKTENSLNDDIILPYMNNSIIVNNSDFENSSNTLFVNKKSTNCDIKLNLSIDNRNTDFLQEKTPGDNVCSDTELVKSTEPVNRDKTPDSSIRPHSKKLLHSHCNTSKHSILDLSIGSKNTEFLQEKTPGDNVCHETEKSAERIHKEKTPDSPIRPNSKNLLRSHCDTSKNSILNLSLTENILSHTPNLENSYMQSSSYMVSSPELFSDEELDSSENTSLHINNVTFSERSEKYFGEKSDKTLLKRVQDSLSGILPPPSVTICQLNVTDLLTKIKENQHLFLKPEENDLNEENSVDKVQEPKLCKTKSATDRTVSIYNYREDVEKCEWPDTLAIRYHGIHYNRSKLSEDFELLCLRYSERYVGCETASSCTVWPLNTTRTPSKRLMRSRLPNQSPAKRFNHLARRRIMFSSASILGSNRVVALNGTKSTRQILIDVKRNDPLKRKGKSPRKISPRKRTPSKLSKGKSPRKKVKTPTSSKKKVARRLVMSTNDIKCSNSKRALFQSPDKIVSATQISKTPIKTKRALIFSPTKLQKKNLGSNNECENRKRKRQNSEEECSPQRDKFLRSFSSGDVQPTDSKGCVLNRRYSELVPGTSNKLDLSDINKKKLLWAVAEALRSQNISMSHPNFKQYATVLARVCRKLMPDLSNSGSSRGLGSTSERLARVTRQHVYAVVKGKTAEEILSGENVQQNLKVGQVSCEKPLPENSSKINLCETFAENNRPKSILKDRNIDTQKNCDDMKSLQTNATVVNKADKIKRKIIFDSKEPS